MIKIAICDDSEMQLELLREYMEIYLKLFPLEVSYKCFTNGAELIDSYENGERFDIYFLDMIMPDYTGIEVAAKLRETGDESKIVFLTGAPEYVFKAFEVRASDYLLIPLLPEKFFDCLNKLCEEIKDEASRFYSVKSPDGEKVIDGNNLVYIESINRTPHYHMIDGTVVQGISTRVKFSEAIAPFLHKRDFLLTSVCVAVNSKMIKTVQGNVVYLKNGESVPLTRNFAAEFKKAKKI